MSASYLKASDLKENLESGPGREHELSVPLKTSRTTPRSPLAGISSPGAPKTTPYADLRRLAAIVRKPSTPGTRAASVGARRSQSHALAHTPNTSRVRQPLQQLPMHRSNPSTPYALRAFQHRRATPGQDRRKSGRLQRKTPRDALRDLSRVLAPISQPTRPSPKSPRPESNTWEQTADDELEDESDLQQPRFSIAIDSEDDDYGDFDEAPPRLSLPLGVGEETGRSVEAARHVATAYQKAKASRGSLRSIGASQLLSDTASDLIDTSQALIDDDGASPMDVDADELGDIKLGLDDDGSAEELRRRMSDSSGQSKQRSSPRRDLRIPKTDGHSPFVLHIPYLDTREVSPLGVSLRSVSPSHQLLGNQEPGISLAKVPNPAIAKAHVHFRHRRRNSKTLKTSRHGIQYPSLPAGITKKIVSNSIRERGSNKQARISKDILKAIIEAGDQYLEQLCGDLSAFANHAGRKKIDDSDIIAVMKRQRLLSAAATPFSLAQGALPAEVVRGLRMPIAKASRRLKKRRLEKIEEDEDDAGPS